MHIPTVGEILTHYFAASSANKHAVTAARYRRVEAHLRCYLEQDGADCLDPSVVTLLASERQFQPGGAFVRVLHADDLVFALPGFLGPAWVLQDFHDRLAQISLASRLVQWLCSRQLVDSKWHRHAVVGTRAAAERARRSGVG